MTSNPKDLEIIITGLINKATCELPPENYKALENAYNQEEEGSIAKRNIETNLKNLAISIEKRIPMCADTGFPCFFVRIGNTSSLNLTVIQEGIIGAVKEATHSSFIRPTVVDPISRENPGNNLGPGSPVIEYRVDPEIDFCEITYAPKGGGTEIFGPSFRTILAADGLNGVKKFVFDSFVVDGNRTGGTCPPNIVGVGIGGTSEKCMSLAKQAACLRKVGSRNPDSRLKELEDDLFRAINESGIGPLGMGGKTTILDIHIELALTHLVGTPVALALQCPAARVGTIRLYDNGDITETDWPGWFKY